MEREISVIAETDPFGRNSISFHEMVNRSGGNEYCLHSSFVENYLGLYVSDETAINWMRSRSPLVRSMFGTEPFCISDTGFREIYKAYSDIPAGVAEWSEYSRDIEVDSISTEIGGGLGIVLGLSFEMEFVSETLYEENKGICMPQKGMLATQTYRNYAYIQNHARGLESIVDQYLGVIEGVVDSSTETVVSVVEKGKETVVEFGETVAEAGAKVKAKAGEMAENVRLKLAKLIKGEESFKIMVQDRSKRSSTEATTVGEVYFVTAVQEDGAVLESFENPLELTLGYTLENLFAAGFSELDASKVKIYRWDSETGDSHAIFTSATAPDALIPCSTESKHGLFPPHACSGSLVPATSGDST